MSAGLKHSPHPAFSTSVHARDKCSTGHLLRESTYLPCPALSAGGEAIITSPKDMNLKMPTEPERLLG